MNYLSIYNSIIDRAKSELRAKRNTSNPLYVYYEKHHIVPKCLGGSDDKSNLVLLTGREHFVCHQLLVKIYPGNHKLIFSVKMMTVSTTTQIRNNKEYEWIKNAMSKSASESQKGKSYGYKFPKGHKLSIGEDNGMHGKNHTKETKVKQSEKAKERDSSYYDFARLPKSTEHKEQISKTKRKCRYKLISPTNEEFIFNKIYDASILSKISISVLIKLAGNRYGFDNCRGWKISAIPIFTY